MTTADLFGRPAIDWAPTSRPTAPEPLPSVLADVSGVYRLDRGPRVVHVEVSVGPLTFSCLTRWGRVVGPTFLGDPAVRFHDRALALRVHRQVVEAAEHAEARGWGP